MSGSSGQAGGSTAPFANVVNSNIGAESAIASGIGNLNTTPASQYGNAAGYGQTLSTQGNQIVGDTNTALAQGSNIYGAYAPYAQSALSTGFNNNNALYSQMYQQNQDQANAENAMAGVATSPYGAALTNQSGQNFNNQWQSYLTGLENTASGTASNLGNLAQTGLNSGDTNAANLLSSGSSAITSGLNTGQSIDTQQYNAQQGSISDLLSLLSTYSGAQNQTLSGALTQAGLNNTGAQQSNANTTAELSGLGSLASSLAKLGISTGAL